MIAIKNLVVYREDLKTYNQHMLSLIVQRYCVIIVVIIIIMHPFL